MILWRGLLQEHAEDIGGKGTYFEYLGLLDYKEMPVYHSACDVFVIPRPSRLPAENLMPARSLEAMAMEKTVLGSNLGGITEVVINDKNGIVFERGNKKINCIIEDIENLDRVRKQARKSAINKYNWQKWSERLQQNVYEDVI